MTANEPNDIPQVQDKRPRIVGSLPRNTQALVLGGIALLMILVILFSGHNPPKEHRPAPSPSSTTPKEPDPSRIHDYRAQIEEQMRRLAAEEAELAKSKAALAGRPDAPGSTTLPTGEVLQVPHTAVVHPDPDKNWIERDREKREYQSLFASNLALSYRRESSEPAIRKTEPSDSPISGKPIESVSGTEASMETGQYRLFEGAVLETVLTNRLDSSFSGPIDCMVTTDVYSHDQQKLLIPQGSRVLGEVKKLETYGEQRLAVSFHRLIMPDGFSVSLDKFKGLDQIGETGLRDQVNHHYLQVFGVSIALGGLAGLSQANTRYSLDESASQAYRQGVTGSVSQSATHILDRFLNVLPTFTVREGYRVKVYLSQDLVLPSYDQHPVRKDL